MQLQSIAIGRRAVAIPALGWAALGVLAFSGTFPATVVALRGFDPLVVGAGRSVLAAALAGVCLLAVRARLPARDQWMGLVLVAMGCGVGFGVLSALALGTVTASHAAVVTGLLPGATATVAVLRGGERASPLFWLASAGGAVTVVLFSLLEGAGSLSGADMLLLVALIIGAIGYAEGGRLARGMPGWQVVGWGVVLALPVSLPITVGALATSSTAVHATGAAVLGLAYVSVVSMFLGFFGWYRGLAQAGVARASQLQLAQPFLTVAWSAAMLGERPGWSTFVAATVVLACVAASQRARFTTPAGRRTTLNAVLPAAEERAALQDTAHTPLGGRALRG